MKEKNMKLYLLRPKEDNTIWKPWYDKTFGFVVRAESESEARLLASEESGEEGDKAWLDGRYSTCEELTSKGKSEVVIKDFAAA